MNKQNEHNLLYTDDGKIVTPFEMLRQEKGFVILSIYQSDILFDFFKKYPHGSHGQCYKLQGELYSLRYLLFDVIECDLQKIKNLFFAGPIIFSESQLKQTVQQDHLLPDEYGPKGIVLVLERTT